MEKTRCAIVVFVVHRLAFNCLLFYTLFSLQIVMFAGKNNFLKMAVQNLHFAIVPCVPPNQCMVISLEDAIEAI